MKVGVAQLVERPTVTRTAEGSSPSPDVNAERNKHRSVAIQNRAPTMTTKTREGA